MARVKRSHRSEFGPRKNPLPSELEFLKDVPFHSVAEHTAHGSRQVRIEFTIRSLRPIVEKFHRAQEIEEENESLRARLGYLENMVENLKDMVEKLEAVNNQLMENLRQLKPSQSHEVRSDTKGYFQVADERGFEPKGLPRQGGLPGLGKKR